jgi:hypothetical protein
MINLWARASRAEWLSPEERAILKLVKGFAISAILTGLTAIYPIISGSQTATDWISVLKVFSTAFIMTIIVAVDKYISSHVSASPQPEETTSTPTLDADHKPDNRPVL